MDMMEMNQIGDVPINVVMTKTEGEVQGDVVFVHMSWGGAWAWMMYQKEFTSRGYNTYALDLRGHGMSGGSVEGATMNDYKKDVRSVVEHFELDNPIIIGHSMGGLVAMDYASEYGARALVDMDGSPSLEVIGEGVEKEYPASYTPMDAGMPTEPMEVMKAFSDISPDMLIKMKDMLGKESGVARSDRKRGVSVPVDSLNIPKLFVGAELGTSVSFGIGIEKATKQSEVYGGDLIEIKGATHPGLLIGEHVPETIKQICMWLLDK